MCLSESLEKEVLSYTARKNLKAKIGYKVFWKRGDVLYGSYRTMFTYNENHWMKDKCKKKLQYEINLKHYDSGFHIFLTKTAAKTWKKSLAHCVTYKVKYKNIIDVGRQGFKPVVVAREMIIKEIIKT